MFFVANMRIINDYIHSVIQERRKSPELETHRDLLSLNMQHAQHINDSSLLTDGYLRDLILNFMIAGRDTTACALTWLFKSLSEHPKEAEEFYREVDSLVLGKGPIEGILHFDSFKETRHIESWVKETLRLYPPVPSDVVTAANDDVLPDGTFVPKGSFVFFPAYSANRNPNTWTEATAFKPSRWLDAKINSFQFPTFKAGPRICLGQTMAFLEIEMLSTIIFSKYRVDVLPNQSEEHDGSIILFLKNGLKATIRQREDISS